ncbi:hypothetical protein TKK_0018064 [Trichogramma kaykai]
MSDSAGRDGGGGSVLRAKKLLAGREVAKFQVALKRVAESRSAPLLSYVFFLSAKCFSQRVDLAFLGLSSPGKSEGNLLCFVNEGDSPDKGSLLNLQSPAEAWKVVECVTDPCWLLEFPWSSLRK